VRHEVIEKARISSQGPHVVLVVKPFVLVASSAGFRIITPRMNKVVAMSRSGGHLRLGAGRLWQ